MTPSFSQERFYFFFIYCPIKKITWQHMATVPEQELELLFRFHSHQMVRNASNRTGIGFCPKKLLERPEPINHTVSPSKNLNRMPVRILWAFSRDTTIPVVEYLLYSTQVQILRSALSIDGF